MKSQKSHYRQVPIMHILIIRKLVTKHLEIKNQQKGANNPKTKKSIQKLQIFHKNLHKNTCKKGI